MVKARVSRGAATVETAVVAILLFTLVLGVVEFGRAVWLQQGLSAAAREAARYGIATDDSSGSPQYLDCPGMIDAAQARSPDLNLADGEIEIFYDHPTGPDGDCDAPGTVVNGTRVIVTTRRDLDVNLPLVPLGPIELSATDSRSIYNGQAGP